MMMTSKTIAPTSNQTVALLPRGASVTGGAGGVATGGALCVVGSGVGVAAGVLLAGGVTADGAGVGGGVAPPVAGGAFHFDGGTMTVAPKSAADCFRSAACADIGAPHS